MDNATILIDKKFKDTIVTLRFLQPLKKEYFLANTVLANYMIDVCQRYDTKQKVSLKLDDLYGSELQMNCSIVGNSQILSVTMCSINARYAKDKSMLQEQFALLSEFIFHPLRKNGSFCLETFKEAKKIQRENMQRIEDDPSSYCLNEALRIVGGDEPIGIGSLLDYDGLEALTLSEVEAAYRRLLDESKIHLLVLGDIDQAETNKLIETYFHAFAQAPWSHCLGYHLPKRSLAPIYYGYKELGQTYIANVYYTHIHYEDQDYEALKVANAIFGQLPSSLLFQDVRETKSLCYSIYAHTAPYDGLMAVTTGIEKQNTDEVLDLLKEEFIKMQRGQFTDEVLETAKIMLIHSLETIHDSMSRILARSYRNALSLHPMSIEAEIEALRQISRKDVLDVMQKMEYATSYVLTSHGGNEDEEDH